MHYPKNIAIVVGIVIAGVAGYIFFAGEPREESAATGFLWNPAAETGGGSAAERYIAESGFPATYRDEVYGFSFSHPDDMKITEFSEDTGDVILAQGAGDRSFQIFIAPFDEDPETYATGEGGPISPTRIREDVPKMAIESPQAIVVNDIPILVFFSTHPELGRTREVWFVWPPEPYPHGNYLYQVTAFEEFDATLSQIMASFKFQ